MRDVHREPHVREVEAIAQIDQRERDDVVPDQLLEVLARLLQHQQQHDHLLGPVRRLQQVVRLEDRGGTDAAARAGSPDRRKPIPRLERPVADRFLDVGGKSLVTLHRFMRPRSYA